MKKAFSNFFVFLFLFITVISVEVWSTITLSPSKTFSLIRTFILIIPFVWAIKVFKNPLNKSRKGVDIFFLGLIIITGIRSILIAKGKEQWSMVLAYFPAMLSFIAVYYLDYPLLFRKINYFWFRIAPLLFLLWIPFIRSTGEVMGYFLPLFILYLIFIRVIPNKSKGIVLTITLLILFVCYIEGARSHVLKYGIALISGISLYFKSSWFYVKAIKIARNILLLTPIIFFLLGITNVFNVFNTDEYLSGDFTYESTNKYGEKSEASLVSDTRTFLYEESIISAIENKYVLFGRSFARGYDSYWEVKRVEKLGAMINTETVDRISEVAIINIFTWMGLLGVVLYFFVFVKATSLAIYHSNNNYIKIIGLYLAFRWMYGWVEDFQRLDISTLTLWMLFAMCFSKGFRSLTDYQIAKFIRSIFIK